MKRQLDKAESVLTAALALAPECAQALHLLGVAQRMRGDTSSALRTLQQACDLAPAESRLQMDLSITLFECGDIASAMRHIEHACVLAPKTAAVWFNKGKMLKEQGLATDAREALLRTLQLDRRHVSARLLLAELAASRGDGSDAAFQYRHVLTHHPHHPTAWLGLANLKTERFTLQDVGHLRVALRDGALGGQARVPLGFALARALEDQGDYDGAFDALTQANRVMSRQVNWDPARAREEVDSLITAFDRPAPLTGASHLGHEVIFIVSLPRTGSSLIEQILASHPCVEGGGELLDLQQVLDQESRRRGQVFPQWVMHAGPADWDRLGRSYLERTAHLRQLRPVSTDKNLINWQFVGAIRAMLPGARIINCRRDPLETCLAGFRQLFRTGNGFSYDLGHMVSRWHDYDRLCGVWRRRFPGHFHEHHHEQLLADPVAEIVKLTEACGLDFDPACMAFHQNDRIVRTASAVQVRQPLKASTALASLYGERLGHLRQLLSEVHAAGGR